MATLLTASVAGAKKYRAVFFTKSTKAVPTFLKGVNGSIEAVDKN